MSGFLFDYILENNERRYLDFAEKNHSYLNFILEASWYQIAGLLKQEVKSTYFLISHDRQRD
jgi:hypothetical protein